MSKTCAASLIVVTCLTLRQQIHAFAPPTPPGVRIAPSRYGVKGRSLVDLQHRLSEPSEPRPSRTTRLALKLPRQDGVKDSLNRSQNFLHHLDRFLGSLFFSNDDDDDDNNNLDLNNIQRSPPPTLSSRINDATASISLNLWKGATLPFPSLRQVMLLRERPKSRTSGRGDAASQLGLGLSFRNSILFLASYLLIGVAAYSSVLEKWSIVDALYFSCTCLTSVGYGDCIPTHPLSQAFTCAFGLGGIAFLGSALASVGGSVVKAELDAAQQARGDTRNRLLQLFEGLPQVVASYRRPRGPSSSYLESLSQPSLRSSKLPDDIKTVSAFDKFRRFLPALGMVVVGGAIMNHLNGGGWSILETVYFSIMTATTIGLGDIAPQTDAARLFAVVFVPLAVATAGEALSSVALSILRKRQRRAYEAQLERDLTIQHLQAMDADGDGRITREEYVQFMLLEMGLVSQDDLRELHRQFERLDVARSGYLDNDDLRLMAELRGATVQDS